MLENSRTEAWQVRLGGRVQRTKVGGRGNQKCTEGDSPRLSCQLQPLRLKCMLLNFMKGGGESRERGAGREGKRENEASAPVHPGNKGSFTITEGLKVTEVYIQVRLNL